METATSSVSCIRRKRRPSLGRGVIRQSRRGQEAPGSDVDVCLVLDPQGAHDTTGEIRLEYLEATPPSFDVQVYQRLPLYVRRRILAEGKVLYCRGEDALYDLARQTIREFETFALGTSAISTRWACGS